MSDTAIAPPDLSLADVYGRAYRWLERTGGREGRTELEYETEDGARYREDAAVYYGGPRTWAPSDALACELATGRVLDIGCGAGRYALELARSGHQVVGIEPSPDAVAVARRRGVDARLGGLAGLPPGLGGFDTFLLLGASLALLTACPSTRDTLAGLAALAGPGAQLLGSDIWMPSAAPTSRLRVRARHGAERTPWSTWQEGQPYVSAARLDALVDGTAWHVERTHYPDGDGAGTYLVQLRLGPARPGDLDGR